MAAATLTPFIPPVSGIEHRFRCSASVALASHCQKIKWCRRKRDAQFRALYVDDEDYLVDAPASIGDGFSFSGGKYSNEAGRAEKWVARGKMIKAYPVEGGLQKAREPLFGLSMGDASQISDDTFRWFCVEEGDPEKPSVLLIHGFPSQAYSFRTVLPILSPDFHVVAFDWLGFGFSDKPQPKYGFNYTTEEYTAALTLLVESIGMKKLSIVSQGYFAPVIASFAAMNQHKVDRLIFLNPPVTEEHAKLPPALTSFSNFLLGEIFAQDPLKASDKPLNECGPYLLDEEDAMVYRKPYLSSGSAGFALTAISKALKKELKGSIIEFRKTLSRPEWKKQTTIIWGMKDRWLSFKGVEEFTGSAKLQLLKLPEVGHHGQEDFAEEVGAVIKTALRKPVLA